MNKRTILTEKQKLFLSLFFNDPISSQFYLTGGTALAEFYIPYRFSEDLDFFTENEVDQTSIAVFLRSIKDQLQYNSFESNTSFNRNIFLLQFGNEILKTEFTYFPFPPIEKPKIFNKTKVDSILDISVNKLFTIYQNPRSRDFMDLYLIHKHYHFPLSELIDKAKLKFDWHVDKLKLGSQFLQALELKDYPKLIKTLDEKLWQNYFKQEAKKLGKQIMA